MEGDARLQQEGVVGGERRGGGRRGGARLQPLQQLLRQLRRVQCGRHTASGTGTARQAAAEVFNTPLTAGFEVCDVQTPASQPMLRRKYGVSLFCD